MVQTMANPMTQRQSPASDACPDEGPALRLADAALDAVQSPARQMQQTIEMRLSAAGEARWSARRTLGFLLLTNGLFWAGVALVVRAVV